MDTEYKSPNYNDRAGYTKPVMIVVHYTGMKTAKEALERLCDPEAKVSAHYVIEENGFVHQLVDEDKRAWHAGVSEWEIHGAAETDINSASIGIELVNPGHEFGYRPFPHEQMASLAKLCKAIMERYEIEYILGHEDVAPGRKQDPGELFDWLWLAMRGVPNIHA